MKLRSLVEILTTCTSVSRSPTVYYPKCYIEVSLIETERVTENKTEREREREREKEREKERQREKERDRDTDRQTGTAKERETDR